jgi:hypothetical protein
MRVQGDNELVPPDLGPHPAVHTVRRTHHPAQIKVQSLARAAIRWRWHEKSNTDTPLQFAAWVELLEASPQHRGRETFHGRPCMFV